MGEFFTKEKVREILENAPPDLDKRKLLRSMANQGHEMEGHNAEFSPLDMVKNVPESTKEFGKAIWAAITNPLQSINAMSDLARGGLRRGGEVIGVKLAEGGLMGTEEEGKLFDSMVEFFIDRYGSKDRIFETIERDPVGFLADASTIIGGAGAVVKGGGLAVKGMGRALMGGDKTLGIIKQSLKKPHERIPPFKGVDKIKTTPEKLFAVGGKISKTGSVLFKYSRNLEPTTLAIKTARRVNEVVGINKLIRASSARFMAKATGLSKAVRSNIAKSANLPEDPTIWMSKHGIHGSLEGMHKQLGNIQDKTVGIVDGLLGSVDDLYKTDSATKFLDELQTAYGKVKKKKDLDPEFVKRRNLSQVAEENLAEIQELLEKSKNEGLTLTELNRTKRIGDRILNIYDRAGEAKAAQTAQNLSELRSEIRVFIEDSAKEKGVPDIRELNKQTQVSMLLKENINDLLIATETRSAIGDQLIFLMGLTGTVASGGAAPIIGAGVVVGGREIVRIPRVRSFLANRSRLMADGDYQVLLRSKQGVETGKMSKKLDEIVRRERRLLQKAFPELRLAGIAQERIPVKEGQQ
jgi:hypothetical protein